MAVAAECVHDDVRSRATVEYVAEYVQLVYAQPLDYVAEGYYEGVGLSGGYYGLYNPVEVCLLVVVGWRFVQQFLNDVREFAREGLAYLRPGVF